MRYIDNPNIAKRYRSKDWAKVRRLKLACNPFFERCLREGIYKAAEIVHHKTYINELNYRDDNIFLGLDNLESICIAHHNREHFEDKLEYYFDKEGNVCKNK